MEVSVSFTLSRYENKQRARRMSRAISTISDYVRDLEAVLEQAVGSSDRLDEVMIIIEDEDDSFFFRLPSRSKQYDLRVGWQREGHGEPDGPAGMVKLVGRKVRQVFARLPYPAPLRQMVLHEVHEWEKATLACLTPTE
jgi:hypothetical protein